jgi:predicted RNase H-like HicB family nuclease
MKQENDLQFYRKQMPDMLNLNIQKTDEGFWAKVKELPHCYTQARDFFELIRMVNDAVYTYLEIPDNFKKKVGFYLPKEICEVIDEVERKEWEKTLQEMKELSEKSNLKTGQATLQMCLS